MRFTIVTIAAIAGLALGQGQGGLNLPTCANQCVTDATSGSKLGGCELFNIKCICENDSFLDSIACCLAENCEVADQEKAATEALNFCALVGATDLPTAVVCKTTSSSPSSTATSSISSTAITSGPSAIPTASTTPSASGASAATTPSATPNAGLHNMAGVGAGVLGAFAAVLL